MCIFFISFETPLNFSICTFVFKTVISCRKAPRQPFCIIYNRSTRGKALWSNSLSCHLVGFKAQSVGSQGKDLPVSDVMWSMEREIIGHWILKSLLFVWKSDSRCLKDWSPSKTHLNSYSQATMAEEKNCLVHFIQHISNRFKVWYWSAKWQVRGLL